MGDDRFGRPDGAVALLVLTLQRVETLFVTSCDSLLFMAALCVDDSWARVRLL